MAQPLQGPLHVLFVIRGSRVRVHTRSMFHSVSTDYAKDREFGDSFFSIRKNSRIIRLFAIREIREIRIFS